ncbi:MAG: hypothetical protein ACJAVA_002539 [Flavobacteriaceae bacterium]|jgi:hypothetical protein
MKLAEEKIIEILQKKIITKNYLLSVCDQVKVVLKNKSQGDIRVKLSKESQLSETKQ